MRTLQKIYLVKDEEVKISVKYKRFTKIFTLRWTLYKNEGLVTFHSYSKQVFQHVLYLNTTNQNFKQHLKPKGADFYETPYFLVNFKEYDPKKKRVRFKIILYDPKKQIKVEFIKQRNTE